MSARSPMNTSTAAPVETALMRASVASALRGLRATMPTRAPRRASSIAAASPMPFVAPVTIITGGSLMTLPSAPPRCRTPSTAASAERRDEAELVERDCGPCAARLAVRRATAIRARTPRRDVLRDAVGRARGCGGGRIITAAISPRMNGRLDRDRAGAARGLSVGHVRAQVVAGEREVPRLLGDVDAHDALEQRVQLAARPQRRALHVVDRVLAAEHEHEEQRGEAARRCR